MAGPAAIFEQDRIRIERYPFAPGSCRKTLSIAASEIVEAEPRLCTLRLADELIYLPGWPRDELLAFCSRNSIPVRERYDVWADILEPYVDNQLSGAEVRARRERLEAAQVSAAEVARLRSLYAVPIVLYQGIAGEWMFLRHYDLLYSLRGLRLLGLYGLAYRHTMSIALKYFL